VSGSGQPRASGPAFRRVRKSKARRKSQPELAAAGSLIRTKALLLAALRVWELKNRISD
jgi:hypothetical protein